jgi:hypothetical protein
MLVENVRVLKHDLVTYATVHRRCSLRPVLTCALVERGAHGQ